MAADSHLDPYAQDRFGDVLEFEIGQGQSFLARGSDRSMNVFLSRASVDEKLAEQVREGLESRGLKVWSDQSIAPGEVWGGSIDAALEDADSFVFLLGSGSSPGPWTSLELGKALASGKRVVPVLVEPDAEVPAMLQGYQYLDLSDPAARDRGIGRLSKALEGPGPQQSAADAVQIVKEATARLADSRMAEAQRTRMRLEYLARVQLVVAVFLGLVSGGVLVGVAASGNVVVLSAISAALVVLSWAAGFYRGRIEKRTAADD